VTEAAVRPLPAPLCRYLDRELVLSQRAAKGPVSALGEGDPDTALARIAACSAAAGPLRRTGQAVYRIVQTLDGAPLIGRTGRHKVTILAGFGDAAAFVAPAVARVLAGSASDDDRAYFEARDVSRAAHRQVVAETEVTAAGAAA
jgi:hypothetical protein